MSESGVHRPHVAGIHGRENEGSYSIVLSGGYEDDKVYTCTFRLYMYVLCMYTVHLLNVHVFRLYYTCTCTPTVFTVCWVTCMFYVCTCI